TNANLRRPGRALVSECSRNRRRQNRSESTEQIHQCVRASAETSTSKGLLRPNLRRKLERRFALTTVANSSTQCQRVSFAGSCPESKRAPEGVTPHGEPRKEF